MFRSFGNDFLFFPIGLFHQYVHVMSLDVILSFLNFKSGKFMKGVFGFHWSLLHSIKDPSAHYEKVLLCWWKKERNIQRHRVPNALRSIHKCKSQMLMWSPNADAHIDGLAWAHILNLKNQRWNCLHYIVINEMKWNEMNGLHSRTWALDKAICGNRAYLYNDNNNNNNHNNNM